MEPFTIRCETCRAKLRVRDERVLGQIHECPKCRSMVLIAAPAAGVAAVAAGSSTLAASPQETLIFPAVQPVSPVVDEVAVAEAISVEAPPVVLPPAAADWSRVVFWSAGGAALFIAGGIVAAVALRGGEAPAVNASVPPTIASNDKQPEAPVTIVEEPVETLAESQIEIPQATEVVAPAPPVVEEKVADVQPIQPPVAAAPVAPPVVHEEAPPAKTMTLEPVKPAPTVGELVAQLEEPRYETVVEQPAGPAVEAKPQADGVPGAVTNVQEQMALPIVAIELNAVPLSSFVETISEMAAIPIQLDADALKAAGVSPRTKITVRAQDETIASLLTATLAQHHLAWEERDGKIFVVAQ